MNEDKRFYIGVSITIVIALIIGVACIWFLIDKSNQNKYETMTNLPAESWFEEDLEEPLLSKEITITEIWRNVDTLLVVAEASYDNAVCTYRCQYQLKQGMLCSWYWEYVRAVRI